MTITASRTRLLIETLVVFAFYHYAAKVVGVVAKFAHITLPDQPILRHTYLAFLAVLLIILWLWRSGVDLAQFGLVMPRRWLTMIGWGIALAVVSIMVDSLVRSVATPLIVAWTGANPHLDAEAFAAIRGNTGIYLLTIPAVWMFAAFGEEFIFRGYLLTRIAQIFGQSRLAWGAAIVVQAVLFGLSHWYQGPVGMVPIGVGALVSGVATTAWGRNLWPAMIAHGLVDTLGITMLYMGQPIL